MTMKHTCSPARTFREATTGDILCLDCGEPVAERKARAMTQKTKSTCMFCGGPREPGKPSAEHGCSGAEQFWRDEAKRKVRAAVTRARTIPAAPDAATYTVALNAGKTADEAMVLARKAGAERAAGDARRNADARDYRAKLKVNSARRDTVPAAPDLGRYLRALDAGKSADEAMAAARAGAS